MQADIFASDSGANGARTRTWTVGALCRAVADALEARFGAVTVRGEITGFSRASSGHCYFSVKDGQGQLRCAMFRRAAGWLGFVPTEGEQVELRGRLALYEPRGELQLIVESMVRVGAGALYEQLLQRKARLQAQGLFDAARKRPVPAMPRGIGVVTSLGAAALHDVVTALQRRVPHIPVLVAPASVQGGAAPGELIAALASLVRATPSARAPVDVILLVRGGGSIEDLWAFNDEALVHAIVASPVPVICGVGHETDFTLADLTADLRAPTPTAAAELAATPRQALTDTLAHAQRRMAQAIRRRWEHQSQRLDRAAARLGRPSGVLARQQLALARQSQRLRHAVSTALLQRGHRLQQLQADLDRARQRPVLTQRERLERAAWRLQALDPALVLQRGYAWLSEPGGRPITRVADARVGQAVRATLADGEVDLRVTLQRQA